MTTRLTHALPIDVTRLFDNTVTQTQIDANEFQNNPDNDDLLSSMIEDAEDELRQLSDVTLRVSREGVAGKRETYESVDYRLSGHKLYRQRFSHGTFDYSFEDVTVEVQNNRLLPFDDTLGDQVFIWRGIDDGWQDITSDQGETWDVLDYRDGMIVISAEEVRRAMTRQIHSNGLGGGRQTRVRLQLSYRYGGLGGARSQPTQTDLDESITDAQTGTVNVKDGSGFPTGEGSGSIVVLVGREYMSVVPDPGNDQMDIVERGVRGTTAAAHSSGDRVQYTPPSIRKAVAARAAQQLIDSGRYSAFLPDSDDEIGKDDMHSNFGSIWQGTIDALS